MASGLGMANVPGTVPSVTPPKAVALLTVTPSIMYVFWPVVPPFTAMFVAPLPMVVALLTLAETPVDIASRFV